MAGTKELILRGIPVSRGFARGRVFVYRQYLPELVERAIKPREVPVELRRFRRAVDDARAELKQLHARVRQDMGRDFAEFIDVQLALVGDEEIIKATEQAITEFRRNAEFSYAETLKQLTRPVTGSDASLFRERALDVFDVGSRVLKHLLGEAFPSLHSIEPGAIVVARDLPPSEAALLDPKRVNGLVLEGGGKTSHTAIMAKAKEIPAVVAVESVLRVAGDGHEALVDGYRGLAIIAPTQRRLAAYQSDIELYKRHREVLAGLAEQEAVTLDGRMIDLSANIEFVAEARAARRNGARGIGLFRTEYIYLSRLQPPSEDEQYEVLAEVARTMKPGPVIVRTFDLGGDKVVPGYVESNPFLGWRGLRLCLDNVEFFKCQLRAILRASAHGTVKIMFPMVATVEELRRAKLVLAGVKRDLKRERVEFDDGVEVGVMVETPSAALLAHRLAQECSFLSIGSNDLTQYTLAVDRGNQRVAGLYDHFHPAVLELIRMTIAAAHRQGIWVGLCGEFAGDPLGIMVLLGLGIDELSVAPGLLPETKKIIRSIDVGSAREIMQSATELTTALEVRRMLRREMISRFPKLAEFVFEFGGGENGDKR